METFDKNNRHNRRLGLGIILLLFGSIFLLKNLGLFIPFWILSWHTILLAVGLWFGYNKNFKAGGWVVMALVGGIFTLKDILLFDISSFVPAMFLIGLGLYMIIKPKKDLEFCGYRRRKEHLDFNGKIPD